MEDEQEVIEQEEMAEVTDEAVEEAVEEVADGDDVAAEEDGGVVVTIGDEEQEEEQEKAPEWVKDLRKANREDKRRIRELESRLQEKAAPAKTELGAKPTLEGFDYDADKFEAALESWYERKRTFDDEESRRRQAEEQQKREWQGKLDAYGKAKAALKVPDFDDAEGVILELFDQTQQGVMLQGADNPALVTYALGRNEAKAKELAAIKDPVKFAFAVAKLETQLKVKGKKTLPPPEKTITGTAASSGAVDSTLNRLRAEAAKTGDFTKVTAYKRSKRA